MHLLALLRLLVCGWCGRLFVAVAAVAVCAVDCVVLVVDVQCFAG